ncbi:hypothetical protein DDB_G0270558 [Dictyostelium discoideum AX4]|uniref:[acyl-carrier-protein] S-malonyltransferase n=1 Tax=Dictyostelium discoideum TaxID=44689 RepID=Q55DQ6_DICDI|nr:hypothetical protein DDB_G0270558 [Dictyostelium discoideum AX4]EAL72629.1 hypothetical protein DDB_G0270558 [Dictyostelium discoideum AX4]|eukprot:XP_646075.1 hypothetical protein DDB_G0270558 [Dictyostelium discoideum AX4]
MSMNSLIGKRIALLFPGQGSQIVGMGKDLIKDFPYISKIYNHSDKILNFSISNLMFNGPSEELKQTYNTQPALLLHSFSMIKILENELGFINKNKNNNNNNEDDEFKVSSEFLKRFDFALGHSLGEYSALTTSNSIKFSDALELVRYRGQLMSKCDPGVMFALLSKKNMIESGSLLELKSIINQINNKINETSNEIMICNISNINSPNQIVISGNEIGVSKVIELAKSKKLFTKSVKLEVSAAFHSDLMIPSSDKFKLKLNTINFKQPEIDVISNVNSLPYKNNIDKTSESSIQSLLSRQLSSTVEWTSSIQYCIEKWEKENIQLKDCYFVEIGSNNVLTQLLKQIYPNSNSYNIQSSNDLINFIKEFKD